MVNSLQKKMWKPDNDLQALWWDDKEIWLLSKTCVNCGQNYSTLTGFFSVT